MGTAVGAFAQSEAKRVITGTVVALEQGDAIPGVSVTFDETESRDRVLCIAPETDGVLLELSKRFADGWLGCSPEAIALTTDKLALFEHWRKHGVRTPATSDREPTRCEAFPVVWKPRDGCCR